MDEYDGRITVVTDAGAGTTYRLYIDGYAVHTRWRNVDGRQASPSDAVEISLADNTQNGYVTVDADAGPDTADGYLFDGDEFAVDADPALAELWLSGERVDPTEYPFVPDE